MSRVDEALRRAAADGPIIHAPTPVEPPAVQVQESALSAYVGEHVEERRTHEPETATRKEQGAQRVVRPPTDAKRAEAPLRIHASLEGKAVSSRETDPASVEQYRRLAATLLNLQAERGLKTLMVSSAMPAEGKTLTVTNLGLTLSEAYGRRVLLVDADFRRPCLHEMFGVANVTGLAESLQSANRTPSMIPVSPTLSIVSSGRPTSNPMAALSSDRMHAFVGDAAKRFDWVIIDTPPVGLLSDAQLVARTTDAVLFVVGADQTPYEIIQRCLSEIGSERVLGIVLNRATRSPQKVQDYYGSYYGSDRK